MEQQILKKVIVKQIQQNNYLYLVEDIFTKEEFMMKIVGKSRITYWNISVGDALYMVLYFGKNKPGHFIPSKYICLHNEATDLCQQKQAIEAQERENAHHLSLSKRMKWAYNLRTKN